MWTRYFLQEQGYGCNESILYQDNGSAQLLAKNSRISSSKKTQHINIRFFFIKDIINSRELIVKHYPTGEMIADFFTKPLQGAKFIDFRDIIMGAKDNHQQ